MRDSQDNPGRPRRLTRSLEEELLAIRADRARGDLPPGEPLDAPVDFTRAFERGDSFVMVPRAVAKVGMACLTGFFSAFVVFSIVLGLVTSPGWPIFLLFLGASSFLGVYTADLFVKCAVVHPRGILARNLLGGTRVLAWAAIANITLTTRQQRGSTWTIAKLHLHDGTALRVSSSNMKCARLPDVDFWETFGTLLTTYHDLATRATG